MFNITVNVLYSDIDVSLNSGTSQKPFINNTLAKASLNPKRNNMNIKVNLKVSPTICCTANTKYPM